ncbi:MAG TPA: MBL fold metallo-hydrolase [Gemmatimonadaceae bacterium]|nr:MBL fold metallo-hydrolase [Gemmatimonadaceae bacterium]
MPPRGLGFLRWVLTRRVPAELLPHGMPGAEALRAPAIASPHAAPGALSITWVGHATVLVQTGMLNVLTDPIWSARASPVGFAGPKRYVAAAVSLDALPPIDLVLLSHDHYDHLDADTVRRLASAHPSATWFAPLGVASLLRRLGVAHVMELGWWEDARVGDALVTCVPAQHFSGRSLRALGRTLWCGWTLHAGDHRIYFAGDTAYHPDFAAIARACGPFTVALLPIGAYAPRRYMRSVHMDPDEAVQAYTELAAAFRGAQPPCMVPIHWGTFRLSDEPLTEPAARLRRAWERARLPDDRLWMLAHGETRAIR